MSPTKSSAAVTIRPPLIRTDIGFEFILAGMALSPSRTVAELKELRELTGDSEGAQRVAWTETWATARKWLGKKDYARPLQKCYYAAHHPGVTPSGAAGRAPALGRAHAVRIR